MIRTASCLALLAGASFTITEARSQSVSGTVPTLPEFAQTAAYAVAHQNADGGFAASPGQPSTLGATNTGLRVLEYVGGKVPDVEACIRFVKSCKVPGSGFAQAPGGKPDVNTTAVGLLAAGELKIADKAMIDDAVAYFSANSRAFEEVRMSIAGLEAVESKSPDFPRWAAQLEAMRQPDGSFGEGPARAFATGGAAAAILRMGLPLEKREAVIAAIKAGQHPDGAWAKDSGPSDLSSSYRVMRCLYMLRERPDAERLRAYIAHCRQPDGSYAVAPGGRGNLGATYFAAIILRWLRLLDGAPPVLEANAFAPLFNGTDLEGWEGNTSLWSAREGMLVGKSPGLKHNEFLATRHGYRDFILSLRFKLENGQGNSGVQFRSVRVPGTEMSGYQADIGESYWGCLYDESRRNKVLAKASPAALDALKKDDWNHYVLCAAGDRITLYLNGVASVVYREEETGISSDGQIAVQIHAGAPMEVQFKDLRISVLP
jgi:hypothetical protein